ncbi:molybdate transport system permease protein [Methylomagnum ishizawai]|uniref:Molybdenum transport system permease n=1 Tax=Methylomagnum ishizawai TaxID=1760988 RepID=A0A1Y6CVL0_9GAMM|nr:molybdate ABC transporter permease subunit [Methylomagnum ishizawai]SMF94260.1 molybdate transport system permease protein [Methylomagnum ishizawai]
MSTLTPEELSALWLSLKVSLCAVLAILPPGIGLGWLLARRRFPGKALIEAALQLPMVLPPVVTGYVLLLLFGRRGWLGPWLKDTFGLSVAFSWKGAAIAAAVMSFPLMVRSVRLSMSLIEPRLEQAASTLGAGPAGVFLTVTLPLALPGILTGAILGFARSLGEFGATITFVGNIEGETRTLPLALYTYTQTPDGDGPALRLVLISVATAFAALIGSEILTRRAERRLNGD